MMILSPVLHNRMLSVFPRTMCLTLLSTELKPLAKPRVVEFMEPRGARMEPKESPHTFTITRSGTLRWLEWRDQDLHFVARSEMAALYLITGSTFELRNTGFILGST